MPPGVFGKRLPCPTAGRHATTLPPATHPPGAAASAGRQTETWLQRAPGWRPRPSRTPASAAPPRRTALRARRRGGRRDEGRGLQPGVGRTNRPAAALTHKPSKTRHCRPCANTPPTCERAHKVLCRALWRHLCACCRQRPQRARQRIERTARQQRARCAAHQPRTRAQHPHRQPHAGAQQRKGSTQQCVDHSQRGGQAAIAAAAAAALGVCSHRARPWWHVGWVRPPRAAAAALLWMAVDTAGVHIVMRPGQGNGGHTAGSESGRRRRRQPHCPAGSPSGPTHRSTC